MVEIITYKLYDNLHKGYCYDRSDETGGKEHVFNTLEDACETWDKILEEFPEKPSTIIEVHQFINGRYHAKI